MSGAASARAASAVADPAGFGHVLVGLAGVAADLAGLLDSGFLNEAGWDPVSQVLRLPADHPLLGRTRCAG